MGWSGWQYRTVADQYAKTYQGTVEISCENLSFRYFNRGCSETNECKVQLISQTVFRQGSMKLNFNGKQCCA
jgi:hypothetical protein